MMKTERMLHVFQHIKLEILVLSYGDRWRCNGNAVGSLPQSPALMPRYRLSDGGPQSVLPAA